MFHRELQHSHPSEINFGAPGMSLENFSGERQMNRTIQEKKKRKVGFKMNQVVEQLTCRAMCYCVDNLNSRLESHKPALTKLLIHPWIPRRPLQEYIVL